MNSTEVCEDFPMYFEKQKNTATCGVASTAFVLKYVTKKQKYNEKWVISQQPIGQKWGKGKIGMGLSRLLKMNSRLYKANKELDRRFNVEKYGADQIQNEDNFRTIIRNCLKQKIPVTVHFGCTAIYGWSSGHHSPVVAYNEKEDKFLMVDTSSCHIWVPTLLLYLAMDTKDVKNRTVKKWHRGIICVYNKKQPVATCLRGLKKYVPQWKRIKGKDYDYDW